MNSITHTAPSLVTTTTSLDILSSAAAKVESNARRNVKIATSSTANIEVLSKKQNTHSRKANGRKSVAYQRIEIPLSTTLAGTASEENRRCEKVALLAKAIIGHIN